MNIMDKPSLKKVREYFKNAKEVKSIYGRIFEIKDLKLIDYSESNCAIYYDDGSYQVWNNGCYAEIISYKEPLYKLTSKEIVHAFENPQYLKDTFKECFETELEVNRWYKNKLESLHSIFYATEINKENNVFSGYGFQNIDERGFEWIALSKNHWSLRRLQPATEKEVEEALVKEAIKRGYENGNYKCLTIGNTYVHSDNYEYCSDENKLFSGWNKDDRRNMVFNNGIWAEILNTYTIPEAESKFNIKIKAV